MKGLSGLAGLTGLGGKGGTAEPTGKAEISSGLVYSTEAGRM